MNYRRFSLNFHIDKHSVGEKLPRGKYFKSREFIRQFKMQNYV